MGYIFGGNTGITPEQLAQRRRIAEALAMRAVGSAPRNVGEGLSAIGQALASRGISKRLDTREAEGRASADAAFNALFGGGAPESGGMPSVPPAPGGIGSDAAAGPRAMDKYRNVIAAIESQGSGDYSAIGPDTGGGNRAIGRYGIMASNVPSWTKEALGSPMAAEDFAKDSRAQDAVFDEIFGGYLKGNSPQDAASMWFTGRPLAEGANRSDVLGTTGSEYVDKFNRLLGEGGAGAGSMATSGAGPSVMAAGGQGLDPRLIKAMSNPWLTEGQRAVLGSLLKQRLDAMAPKDPIKVGKGDTLLDPSTYEPLYAPPAGGSDPFTLSEGQVRYGANGKIVARGPEKPDNPLTLAPGNVLFDPATGQPVYSAPFKPDALSPDAFDQQKALREAGRASTTVNVGPTGIDYGDPPTDMQWVRSPDGAVQLDERGVPQALPIAGTKLYQAQQEAEDAAATVKEQQQRTSNVVTQDVDRAVAMIEANPYLTTGIGAQLLSDWGGSKAKDVSSLIDTVKANVGFDRLQQMRDASPTGGALGQVSEFENRLLQSVVGSLEQSQSAGQLMFNLRRVRDVYDRIINEGIKPGDPLANVETPETPKPPSEMTDEELLQSLGGQ